MERISRETAEMKRHHQVENVHVENGVLYLTVDGNSIQCDLKNISPVLAAAREEELKELAVSPSGYGVHWPLLDEDISIDGLLGVVHKPGTDRKSA